jgi:ABC-2 type transport system permease protein
MIETAIVLLVAIFIFLSNYAKNEFQAVQLAILVAVPALAFSGMLIPISSLPPIVSYISKVVPLTYGIAIFEGIMLRGWGLNELWFEFTYILGLTIFFFILALLSATDKSKD